MNDVQPIIPPHADPEYVAPAATATEPAPAKTKAKAKDNGIQPPKVTQETQNEILVRVTQDYLDGLDPDDLPDPATIERDLLVQTNFAFAMENSNRVALNRIPLLQTVTFWQVARILIRLHHAVRIIPSDQQGGDRSTNVIGIYCPDGVDEGLYVTDEDAILAVAGRYNPGLTTVLGKEVMGHLRRHAPEVERTLDRDLIPVNNGVFNYKTKELLPFSPEMVLLSKSGVDYDPNAESPVITMPDGEDWDVESWVASLSDDPEVVNSLWEIAGAAIRPHVKWNKAAWLVSSKGENGKGTHVELIRGLVGSRSHVSLPLDKTAKDFMLEPLLRASAIITDENPVGTYLDDVANLKAIITNDTLMVNRKGKPALSYQFWGFMIQCLNDLPMSRDKTDSFYRRQLFIPFTKSYTGRARRYIKDDYVRRPDVLRYVLKRVLHMDYYELSTPRVSVQMLNEQKVANDPVRGFWLWFTENYVNDYAPGVLLYAMYKNWHAKNSSGTKAMGSPQFLRALAELVDADPAWERPRPDNPQHQETVKGRMSRPEPAVKALMVLEYVTTDGKGAPQWGLPLERAFTTNKHKWCVVRSSNQTLDMQILQRVDMACLLFEMDWETYHRDVLAEGVNPAHAEKHASNRRDGGSPCCSISQPRMTDPMRLRRALSREIDEKLKSAWDEASRRGLSYQKPPHKQQGF